MSASIGFQFSPETAAAEAVRLGVPKFWLDRVAEMLRYVCAYGNENQPRRQPRTIVYVTAIRPEQWPGPGTSVRVLTEDNEGWSLEMVFQKFKVYQLRAERVQ